MQSIGSDKGEISFNQFISILDYKKKVDVPVEEQKEAFDALDRDNDE